MPSPETSAPQTAEDQIRAGLGNAQLMNAALALHDNRLSEAEPLLRAHLKANPFDVAAIRMMAELAARVGRPKDSETLLRRALEIAPDFGAARANLATILYRQNRAVEALAELDQLLGDEITPKHLGPGNLGQANLKAAALSKIGGFDEAITLYQAVLDTAPNQPKVWMSLGHMLKTIGRTEEGIAAYRRALELTPRLGEVWWSLANLKTVRFTPKDVAAMQAALNSEDLSNEDRFHLDFALGKALEDEKSYEESFRHYAAGNALRSKALDYNAAETTDFVDRSVALFTPEFFASRKGGGFPDRDPIFILGMPRAGSTLVEQILSSHSQVEGTSELPDIPALARRGANYPERLNTLTSEQFNELGAAYLERTRIQRKSGRPLFIDKLPNNWAHVPFIHLILPNAIIIDARRHPLDCGLSNFKQHFAHGQAFTYNLEDMARYYADYVRLMKHIDFALPTRVHRVIYERMVSDTEAEVRALLTACGLEFENACLRFFETERAVRTASSEQVRRPINRDGTDVWQAYAPWLDPLKTALGSVLNAYPEAPETFR